MKSITLTTFLLLGVLLISNSRGQSVIEQRPLKPTLPLPEVTLASSRLKQWTGEKSWWNSVRAWHYNPDMVQPLWDVWEAFTKPPLSLRMKIMIAAGTDSRNHCPYCLSSAVCFLLKEGVSDRLILG